MKQQGCLFRLLKRVFLPQVQTFFKQTHAFFKENAQVKASMCKNHTLAMPQEYQPLESGPVVSKSKHFAKAVGLLREWKYLQHCKVSKRLNLELVGML